MPTSICALEDSSYPSMAAAGEQGIAVEACPDRRQEFKSMLPQALPRFRRMAMRWLRNPEDAEDAVQEAMLSAFKNIERFDGRAQMSTWLTAIVINAVRMQIRRRPRGHMLPLDHSGEKGQSALSEILADPRPTPEKTLEQRELSELVNKFTGALSLSQHAALRLRLQDDLSIQETAETLGVPQGTVKSQLARGRAILTERFNAATAKPKNSDLGSQFAGKERNISRVPVRSCAGHNAPADQRFHSTRRKRISGWRIEMILRPPSANRIRIQVSREVAVEAHRFRRDFLLSSRAGTDQPTRPEPSLPLACLR